MPDNVKFLQLMLTVSRAEKVEFRKSELIEGLVLWVDDVPELILYSNGTYSVNHETLCSIPDET